MAIRDMGFGLNYNRGFTGKGPSAFGTTGYNEGSRMQADYGDAMRGRGTAFGLEGMRQAGDNNRANIAANAARYGQDLQQGRFNTLLPMFQSELARTGGQVGPAPEITTGPIWNQQQVDQRVNAGKAASDRSTATQQRNTQQQLAGRGFGGNSPLLQALNVQQQMANTGQKTQMEQNTRWDAAQGNAKHVLDTQKARSDQWAQGETIQEQRDRARQNFFSTIMASLMG